MCKFKGVITSEKRIVRTDNHLDQIISDSNHCCFKIYIDKSWCNHIYFLFFLFG